MDLNRSGLFAHGRIAVHRTLDLRTLSNTGGHESLADGTDATANRRCTDDGNSVKRHQRRGRFPRR